MRILIFEGDASLGERCVSWLRAKVGTGGVRIRSVRGFASMLER